MHYTWQDIERDWLQGDQVALADEAVVAAFRIVVDTFGRDWVEAQRVEAGVVRHGASPVLRIAKLGQELAWLGNRPGTDRLIQKIQQGKPDAMVELSASYLVGSDLGCLDLELEPEVNVGGRANRLADFRVRRQGEAWTYAEVTQPGTSKVQADVQQGLRRLGFLVEECEGSFSLEVFLRRDPTPAEVGLVAAEIVSRHATAGVEETALVDDLGTLYWNQTAPGDVRLEDHGEVYTPRLNIAAARIKNDHHRHISVRWPFTDPRVEKFIRSEARQLPTDVPGLIMIQAGRAAGALRGWQPLIERRFQPNINTRISAVCLFATGHHATGAGMIWVTETKLMPNPYATFQLPDWISDRLGRFVR